MSGGLNTKELIINQEPNIIIFGWSYNKNENKMEDVWLGNKWMIIIRLEGAHYFSWSVLRCELIKDSLFDGVIALLSWDVV
jgi:hypothetical protein